MEQTNILSILGVQRKEDVISNLLVHCINGRDQLAQQVLSALDLKDLRFDSVSADTRVMTGEPGMPDIVVVDRLPDRAVVAIVENKLGAEEGEDQTVRYGSSSCHAAIIGRYKLPPQATRFHHRYLTLFPDQEPDDQTFVPVSYRVFIYMGCPTPSGRSWARELLAAWVELITEFYQGGNLDSGAAVYKALSGKGRATSLESGYLAYRELMTEVAAASTIPLRRCSRASRSGRRYYLAKLGLPSWHSDPMEFCDGTWKLNSNRCFDIHIEPQYDVLNGKLSIYLHYETNPYQPDQWLQANLGRADYDAYSLARSEFDQCIRTCESSILRFGGRCNQIAKADIKLGDATVSEAVTSLGTHIRAIAATVDQALSLSNSRGSFGAQ